MSEELNISLPQNSDAEMGLLGSILLNPKHVMGICADKGITAEAFHIPAHAIIFENLEEYTNANLPVDFILLTKMLRTRSLLEKVGGAAFVTSLFTFVPTYANAGYYAEIVLEKWTLRKTIQKCTEIIQEAYSEPEDVRKFLDKAESEVFALTRKDKQSEGGWKEALQEAIEDIEKSFELKGRISGIPTGFPDLDKMTDGLQPADYFVIAARPSVGKSAFAMNLVENMALGSRIPVGVFSLEMSKKQLAKRAISGKASVGLNRLRDGTLTNREIDGLCAAFTALADAKIQIDDRAGLTDAQIKAKLRRWKAEYDIQAAFIDYLQLIRPSRSRKSGNREEDVSGISQSMKEIAKELGISIVVLAQLNRNPEGRNGGRPRISDLRESGSIEQDADIIGLFHRPDYYAESEEQRQELEGQAELIIGKNRNGPVGEVPLTFLKSCTKFVSRAKEFNQ